MPRIKAEPTRKLSSHQRKETDELDESVLDDEEIKRLEHELDVLRREKAEQIQKMRFKRFEKNQRYGDAPYNSSEVDVTLYSDDDQENHENSTVNARQSTRDLADGFEKAHKRYMFNVLNMEEKYRDRERRGLPESKVEIDHYGNFYFPSTMAACHQQAFVNRMFQNDALFGKGSVSAPRNSIQSFEGDARALEKSLRLDKKFEKNLGRPEYLCNERREERIYSSAYVSGIPLRANGPSTSRYNRNYSEDLEDDVFEQPSQKYREYDNARMRFSDNRHDDEDSESNEEFDDDEENSEDDESDETFSEEDETREEDLDEQNGPDFRRSIVQNEERVPPEDHKNHIEASSVLRKPPSLAVTPKIIVKKEPETCQTKSVKSEVSHDSNSPISEGDLSNNSQKIKKEVLNETNRSLASPKIKLESSVTESSLTAKNFPVIAATTTSEQKNVYENALSALESKASAADEPSRESVTDGVSRNSHKYGDIRSFFKKATKKEHVETCEVDRDESKDSDIVILENRRQSTAVDSEKGDRISVMALSERPNRIKKPTEKAAAELYHSHCHSHDHSTDGSPTDKQKDKTKKRKASLEKSPYCKHCEYIKEEKRKSKSSTKQLQDDTKNESIETSIAVKAVVVSKTSQDPKTKSKEARKSGRKSKRDSLKEQSGSNQVKRRSGTSASEEPEKKKQKLIDSDLLSIPSSMAIVVDTELIANQNPLLSHSNIPRFSENFPSQSVWSSTVDVEWIKDVKTVQGKTNKRHFFGVPVSEYPQDVPIINFWVDNLISESFKKDPFTTDYRRVLAQDKKARIDVKAGYDVRF